MDESEGQVLHADSLVRASENGHVDVVALLLASAGAGGNGGNGVNAANRARALVCASACGRLAVVELLLSDDATSDDDGRAATMGRVKPSREPSCEPSSERAFTRASPRARPKKTRAT